MYTAKGNRKSLIIVRKKKVSREWQGKDAPAELKETCKNRKQQVNREVLVRAVEHNGKRTALKRVIKE